MAEATLIVSRFSESELRFVLQFGNLGTGIQARTFLDVDQRRNIARSLERFAECIKGVHSDEPEFVRLGKVLFRLIIPPGMHRLIQGLSKSLIVLTDDPTLPWEILHDGTDFLAMRLSMARQLVVYDSLAGLLRPVEAGSVEGGMLGLVIYDPTNDLDGARAEGEAVSELFASRGQCHVLRGSDANWDNILGHLVGNSYSVIHFCGHIDYDAESGKSWMRLLDGKLSADAVLNVFRGRPVVFLNGCYSDFHNDSSDLGNTELARTETFAQAFMLGSETGVAVAVIGSAWRIPDEPEFAGREFALTFYNALFAGGSLGEALRSSRLMVREKQWGPMIWGPYILYGEPSLAPFQSPVPKVLPADPSQPQLPTTQQEPNATTTDQGSSIIESGAFGTGARKVLHLALSEMRRLGHTCLTTLHLLIGLCDSGDDALLLALGGQEHKVKYVGTRTRELLQGPSERHEGEFSLSRNTAAAILAARYWALLFGRKTITETDLLAGLIGVPKSRALRVLQVFGQESEELLGQLFDSIGSLQRSECSPEAWRGLVRATAEAQRSGSSVVGTPHLVAGLLADRNGPLAKALQRIGLADADLLKALRKDDGEETSA